MGKKEKKKLCKLAGKDYPEKHFDRYVDLVRDPAYVCTKCGRVAESDKNLCKAKKL